MSEFLHPKSMLTPGVAGSLVMSVANSLTLVVPFQPIYVALGLSFVVGILLLRSAAALWERGVYYLLNSLIIFTMAMGANALGQQPTGQAVQLRALTPELRARIEEAPTPELRGRVEEAPGDTPSQFFKPWSF